MKPVRLDIQAARIKRLLDELKTYRDIAEVDRHMRALENRLIELRGISYANRTAERGYREAVIRHGQQTTPEG